MQKTVNTYVHKTVITNTKANDFQEILEKWHARHITPQCMCNVNEDGVGVEIYIAKLTSKDNQPNYVVKRLPETGDKHDPSCSHYELPSTLSGKADLAKNAIMEDEETGMVHLKLNLPFQIKKGVGTESLIEAEEAIPNSDTATRINHSSLNLIGLLHYLIDGTGLAKWSPKMLRDDRSCKRFYGLVRTLLLEQAKKTVAKKTFLAKKICIPPQFKLEKKEEIDNYYQRFINSLAPTRHVDPVGIVIGLFYHFGSHFNSSTVVLRQAGKHLPLILGDQKIKNRIEKKHSFKFEYHIAYELPLMVIATVTSQAGNLHVKAIDFQLMTKQYLPFDTDASYRLTKQLIDDDRHFQVPLRFAMAKDKLLASAILTDTKHATPLIFNEPIETDEAEVTDDFADYDELDNDPVNVDQATQSNEDSIEENEQEDGIELPEHAILLNIDHAKWKLPPTRERMFKL